MTTQTVLSDQLELVNIVSISETKLSKNFSILQNRLNMHDLLFKESQDKTAETTNITLNRISQVEYDSKTSIQQLTAQITEIMNRLNSLDESKIQHDNQLKDNETSIKKVSDELFTTQLQFEEKLSCQQNALNDATAELAQLKRQLERVDQDLRTKESKLEGQKMMREIQKLKKQEVHIQAEIKLHQHKIEKIQLSNQKQERIQAKKDVDFIKQIEQRARKQVKLALKGLAPGSSSGSRGGSNGNSNIYNTQSSSSSYQQKGGQNLKDKSQKKIGKQNNESTVKNSSNLTTSNNNLPENRVSSRLKLPFNMEEDDTAFNEMMKNSTDSPMVKLTDRIKKIEMQMKDVNDVIKSSKFAKKEDRNGQAATSSDGFKEKINELKPEVIKLWAKFDTLEDRLAFNQKKMDEKNKVINDLMSVQKQNNWQKMEEKVKALQAEIFSNIKDIKSKIDLKVNIVDYEKFVHMNEDKIKQMNEMIYQKSDKLEVKKALLFLESKIKEIILVISEDQQNEKDALLTKKPLKCISCDKDVDKFSGVTTGIKGNWDTMPYKQHQPETLGRFGMTNFGSLSKKLKKLQGKDLPLLNKKTNYGNSNIQAGSNSP